ncbi:hypothetical protein H6P87_00862 [Rickettsia tillamookensis]|uniref:Uncharacterized protein n=1 Tax=Rickettsia tillamookensis TaxID=2761623 RepID=A0A9E6SQM8_9RICK|nr:hypothetical protein [Rickettsia tillamookensis]QQV75309.1 hypothetical protein H6P87_00862 [Rickettsia tillamookensis]
MIKITKAKEAYVLGRIIIAYSTTNAYYGREEANIFGDNVTFAIVNPIADIWTSYVGNNSCDGEIVLKLDIFSKADSYYIPTLLSNENLKNSGVDYLDVRYATAKEINTLKNLVQTNKIKLGDHKQEQALKILTTYLAEEIPPHPHLWLPVKEGFVQYWQKIDLYKILEEDALTTLGNTDDQMKCKL